MSDTTTQQPGTPAAVVNDFETTGAVEQTVEASEEEQPKVKPAEIVDDAEDTTDQGKVKKPTSGFKKKIARLEAENAELRAKQSGQPQQPPAEALKKPEQVADGKPKLEDFESHEAWTEALVDWKSELKLGEQKQKEENAKLKTEFDAKISSYEEKKAAAQEKFKDFDEVMSEFDDVPVNPAIHAALLDADDGPGVAYYLATNPEEFEKLNDPKLSILSVNKMIAKIEAKLETTEEPKAAEIKKKVSAAPPPITPVTKGKSSGVFDPNTADFDDYRAHRIKERGGRP